MVLVLLAACGTPETSPFHPRDNSTITLSTGSGAVGIRVEIADTEAAWQRGMMGRDEFDENAGMLFVFPESRVRKFWMKDTSIPLDLLFFNSDLQVIHIQHSAPPCKKDPCPTFGPEKSAQYVLEVNAGWAKEHGVKMGDQLQQNG